MQIAPEQTIEDSSTPEAGAATPALRPRPSLASRAMLAFALMVGFYVLALAVAVGLLGLVYAEWALTRHVNARLAFFAIACACLIFWSIIPRPERFTPPGPRLDADTQPQLIESIAEVSRATGQEMPSEVYLVPDVNAWVGQRGGIMGFGGRKVMGVGLGLLQALTVSQLKAVIAHEFGHYYGGDTKLGPLIYRTRDAIFRSLRNLGRHSGLVQKPFIWYAKAFLRVTHSVSRQQEFVADEVAARVAGARAMADSLRATHAYGLAFDSCWENEVVPILGAGLRPPIAEGFKTFVGTPTVTDAMRKSIESELHEGATDPYDTHPSLPERLAALESLPAGEPPADDPPAITMLNNVEELEKGLLVAMAGRQESRA